MNDTRVLRRTEQRRVILEELRKLNTHPTADEIYHYVRKRLPKISLGTVYRNLEILSGAGLITKLELAGTPKRFDGVTRNHYHVRCMRCGRVDDVPVESIALLERSLRSLTDYEIVSHRLEFIGVCPDCRRETKDVAGEGANTSQTGEAQGDRGGFAVQSGRQRSGNRF